MATIRSGGSCRDFPAFALHLGEMEERLLTPASERAALSERFSRQPGEHR